MIGFGLLGNGTSCIYCIGNTFYSKISLKVGLQSVFRFILPFHEGVKVWLMPFLSALNSIP
jgi:hypothetical protein